MSDLYALLESERTASPEELKKAYRRLARQYHPDANPDNPEAESTFKEISHAYEVLSDPERRSYYDRFGADPASGRGAGPTGSPFDGGFGDLFETFFGGMGQRRGPRGPQVGHDTEIRVGITLVEATFGVDRTVTIAVPVRCPDCEGSGAAPGSSAATCPDCAGAGEVRRVRQSMLGQMVTTSPCMRCQGMGEVIANPCGRCRGDGRITDHVELTITVPPGVDTGTTLRLADRGAVGPRGGPPGNLFVHLLVEDHPDFVREGDDLHREVSITVAQAALGTEVEVETLDGTTRLVVKPGTQPGAVTRVRGEGVTHLRTRSRGDLYLHVVVVVPEGLSEREAALYRELAELRGDAVVEPHHDGLLGKIKSAFS